MQPQTPLHASLADSTRESVSVWLAACLVMVALMVVVGGLTRLTESGLSIVEWKPITGVLPPLNDADWQKEFSEYQESPQFKKSFPDMTIDKFQHIYWLEYVHRLLGRLTGSLFFIPFVFFAFSGRLPFVNLLKFGGIFLLGGLQGAVGWYMVKSGLVDDPHVSPYRLALHLAMGFTLFGLILWQFLSYSYPRTAAGGFELPRPPRLLKIFSCVVLALIFLQAIIGAFVAGLHAGLIYNSFPLMDGQWVPDGLWMQDSWYKNIFEDVTMIQFAHRMMACLLCVAVLLFWLVGRSNPHVAHLLPILFCILVVQFLLGVLTLLFMVPVPLASLHQANALLLFGIAVSIVHRLFLPLKVIAYPMGNKSAIA